MLCPSEVLNMSTSYYNIIGDFNINWLTECANSPFFDLLINNYKYRQLITSFTTNNRTIIDHIYTNLPMSQAKGHILETYFSDHKAICAIINCFN